MNKKRFIPIAAPMLAGNEKDYVLDCLESNWISSLGKYVERFEADFASFCRAKYAVSCCNGTAALHMALLALGTSPGDEVIVPTLTFVATANAVTYCGARPVFIDSEPETWNLNPSLLEAKITPRTRGIIAVHLYGHPADMDTIRKTAQRHGLFVVEDAAEAHGAEYKGNPVGALGDIGTFSFYGNKIITSGEGGMVVTNDAELSARMAQYKGQGIDPRKRYWFPIIGHNYRMTNIAAAIGVAQLEKFTWHLKRRLDVAARYRKMLRSTPGLTWQAEKTWARHVYWMFNILLDDSVSLSRDEVMACLREHGIDTRPIFYPLHTLPPYRDPETEDDCPIARRIAERGISLPTWAGLEEEDVDFICRTLKECIGKTRRH